MVLTRLSLSPSPPLLLFSSRVQKAILSLLRTDVVVGSLVRFVVVGRSL